MAHVLSSPVGARVVTAALKSVGFKRLSRFENANVQIQDSIWRYFAVKAAECGLKQSVRTSREFYVHLGFALFGYY